MIERALTGPFGIDPNAPPEPCCKFIFFISPSVCVSRLRVRCTPWLARHPWLVPLFRGIHRVYRGPKVILLHVLLSPGESAQPHIRHWSQVGRNDSGHPIPTVILWWTTAGDAWFFCFCFCWFNLAWLFFLPAVLVPSLFFKTFFGL